MTSVAVARIWEARNSRADAKLVEAVSIFRWLVHLNFFDVGMISAARRKRSLLVFHGHKRRKEKKKQGFWFCWGYNSNQKKVEKSHFLESEKKKKFFIEFKSKIFIRMK